MNDNDVDLLYEWIHSFSTEEETSAKPELLTIRLFKEAIKEAEGNEGDRLLHIFADNVLPRLIKQLVGTTAKGGKFFERLDAEVQAGLKKAFNRKNAGDQSFLAHLLNGLLPTYRILKKLKTEALETNPVKRNCDDREIALFMAAYILHDFDKFPDYSQWLTANDLEEKFQNRDWHQDPPHKYEAPNFGRAYVAQKISDFGLDELLGENWRSHIDDIVWMSNNAGVKYDADLGLEKRGLQPQIDSRIRGTLANLIRLSDLLASVIKHPSHIEIGRDEISDKKESLAEVLANLSNGQFQFSYHSLSDNRGVLTNIINNALIEVHPREDYTPLLYLPDGVVYLAKGDASPILTEDIPNRVIAKIRSLCAGELKQKTMGFSRDGKGFKFAEYYWLFFDIIELMQVSIEAACRLVPSTKLSSAKKRSDSLLGFQKAGELPSHFDLEFADDYRIDRLAEFGDLLCRRIWEKQQERFLNAQKELPKAQRQAAPQLDLTLKLAEYLGLSDEIPALTAIQSLKKTGGVPLDWYYLAAQYFHCNKGLDDGQVRTLMAEIVEYAAGLLNPICTQLEISDGWNDLRTYISRIVSLPTGAVTQPEIDPFLVELNRYHAAKVTGRGRENVCAMSSSAYTVTEQMETATLFTPQVYSNRQILFNAQAAKRQICSIWSIEIMLRQILMNQTNATGGDFEDRKYRYLYLYPAYFFTPETNKFLQKAYSGIALTRFDADIRKHLISDKQVAKFTLDNYQQVDSLLIVENLLPENDRTFKLSYPSNQPLTFFFLALPPGKDATDTESWVMPAWLAFALPLILDVKTVASESPVPPFLSGAEFEQTVFLDGEHQSIHSLVKRDNYRLDSILPNSSHHREFSPLNALSAAYCIHLEVNRKKDGNPDWGKLADLARDLATSPLYVFHYLNKWLRKQDKIESVSIAKIRLYFQFYTYFEPEGKTMSELAELTRLYRRFYRSKKRFAKANAVLKPIDEAADVILKSDKSLASDTEALTEIVAARLSKLMSNVRRKAAEGKPTLAFVDGEWHPALNPEEERQAVFQFAEYFVKVIFEGKFKCDRARLAGKQLNLIRDTCEYLYRLQDDAEYKNKSLDEPEELSTVELEAV